MSVDDRGGETKDGVPIVERQIDIDIDPPRPGHLTVYSEDVNIKLSSVAALKDLAQISPDIVNNIVSASREAVALDAKKYIFGALAAAVVAISMLVGSVAIIITKGLMPGLAFFVVCAAVASVFSAVFTGKSQPLDWTLRPFRSSKESDEQ